jgi:plastocyanin
VRRVLTLLLFVSTSLLFVGAVPAQAANDVDIVDFAFQPPSITVNPGDTVTWHQKGHVGHSVSSDDPGGFDSSPGCDATPDNDNCLKPLDTYSVTFQSPGTYGYHCKVHPTTMTGTITVLGEETSTTTEVTQPPTTNAAPTTLAATTTSTSSTTTTTSTTTTSTSTTTTTLASSASAPITVKDTGGGGDSSTVPLLIGAAVLVAGLAVLAYWLGLRRRPVHPGGPGPGEPPPTVQGPRI